MTSRRSPTVSTTCWGPQTRQARAVGFVPSRSAFGGTRGSVRVCSPPGPLRPAKRTGKEGRGRGVCRGSGGSRPAHVCRWRPGGRPPPYLPSAPRGWNFLPNLLLRKLDDSSELREGAVNSHGPTIRVWPCLLSRDTHTPAFEPWMGHAFLSEWQTSAQSPRTLRGASPTARSGALSAAACPRPDPRQDAAVAGTQRGCRQHSSL